MQQAVLLLGPTGSGKSPLGKLMAERGLWGHRCRHFDFGERLRAVVARNRPDALITQAEIEFLRDVLQSGALLEDQHFPLAAKILKAFLAEEASQPGVWIVLNGLPRHVGQARAVAEILRVEAVIELTCTPETILARLAGNVGGDRTARVDDDVAAVRNKLAVYAERTAPLVEHYRRQGLSIKTLEVTAGMTPDVMWERVDAIS